MIKCNYEILIELQSVGGMNHDFIHRNFGKQLQL